VLDAARAGIVKLYTSAPLLGELADVLRRPKLARRLELAEVTPQSLVVGYGLLAQLIVPAAIGPVVESDPDDDAVLACAGAARAEAGVSGDRHLLAIETYEGIPILTASNLMARLTS
jgi:predicted nucleic acid-binding protein